MSKTGLTTEEVAAAFEKCGNAVKTAKYLGVARSTVRHHLYKLGIKEGKHLAGGTLDGDIKETKLDLPEKGFIRRFLLTCAQSNTYLNEQVWETLLSVQKYYNAELFVSRFSYNKGAYLNRGNLQKPGAFLDDEEDEDHAITDDGKMWFDPRIVPYASDTRLELAPGLVFCGELNILPTAVRPLSGLETYTGRKSSIIPHVKIAMESIASGNTEPAKFNYTTGTVTLKNYIQKKEGQKAEFHHCYGALLVEVNENGDWWVRQLNADRRGRIYDIGDRDDGIILFAGNKIKFRQRAEAINWGDIHVSEALYDPEVIDANWNEGGMLDMIKPKFQFGHDTFSFLSRNHHDEKDSHRNFEKFINGEDNVATELFKTGEFICQRMLRDWCKVVIVDSNHDRALKKWLNSANYKTDPMNRICFLRLELRQSEAIAVKDERFHLLEHALEQYGAVDPTVVKFLREDESFVICRDASGGIECGNHGHLGVNGAKPAPLQFAKMGRRQNTGHTHSCGIIDGLFTSGVTGKPKRFKYRKGPSSWSQSDIVTYPNGKRTIVTKWHNKYRAA